MESNCSQDLPVPICSTLCENELIRSVKTRAKPEDKRDNQTFITELFSGNELPGSFHQLVDTVLQGTQGGKRGTLLENLRWHIEQYILNLSRSLLIHNWLLVPDHSSHYRKGSFLQSQGFKYQCIHDITEWMKRNGFVHHLEGKKYMGKPMVSRVYPTDQFSNDWLTLALHLQQPFNGNYLRVTDEKSSAWKSFNENPHEYEHYQKIKQVNEFLKSHQWALKGPLILQYKDAVFTGGRIYTPFQNLPSRKFNIRNETYIDGEPICEVDYSASHLRILLSFLYFCDAGDDPYTEIAELTSKDSKGNRTNRKDVKKFITIALGADDRKKGYGELYGSGFTRDRIELIQLATLKRFPMIKPQLFTGFGTKAQSFEGKILLDALCMAMDEGIVMLPIHDAAAVQRKHHEFGIACLQEAWSRSEVSMVGKTKTVVTVKGLN